jgi:hypothetical protein
MTYRFRNKGELSTAQLVYEWIVKHKTGFKFSYQEPATALKIPTEKWPNVSAALITFQKKGMIRANGQRMMVGPKGRKYPTTVFEFIKMIDRRHHSKPIDHKKVKVNKKVKVAIDPTEKQIKKLTGQLLTISVKIEALMLELHKASK